MNPNTVLPITLCCLGAVLLLLRLRLEWRPAASHVPDIGSAMTIGSREVQEDQVGTITTVFGTLLVLADGMGQSYGGRIAGRAAVETFLDLFRDYNAFDHPLYYFRKAFHAANRAILRILDNGGRGAAAVGAAVIQDGKLYYAVVGNVKVCVYRSGDLIPLSAGHTLDVVAQREFRAGRLSRVDALALLETRRQYNYLGQDGFRDVEVFDRPVTLRRGDVVVLLSDGIFDLLSWREIEEVLKSGKDCQSMAYALVERVNTHAAEEKDNAGVVLLRWKEGGA